MAGQSRWPDPGRAALPGAIAQLGERYNGIVEVGGSIPPGSTIAYSQSLRSLHANGGGTIPEPNCAAIDGRGSLFMNRSGQVRPTPIQTTAIPLNKGANI